jgi:hypothetical protein
MAFIGVVDDGGAHGGGVGEPLTGLAGHEGYGGIGGRVLLCGVVQLHPWSPLKTTAGTSGVVLFLPAGAGGIGNLAPEIGYAVPFDAHAASPADVDV